MIENVGELEIESANDANIPVDIWLYPYKEAIENGCEYDGEQNTENLWVLSANNYMPRKAGLGGDGSYVIWGTVEELRELIRKHILPLYEVAVEYLKGMIEGRVNQEGKQIYDGLYYWELPK